MGHRLAQAATRIARRAREPAIRAAYERIAIEECSHADLAAEVAQFCDEHLTPAERARVQSAKKYATAELARELDCDVDPILTFQLGVPNRRESLALLAGLSAAA